ncbi:hypothetical protein V6N11_020097 [Hibiscus sabdariffa]|uniref:Uncharacterized protein n=1 Tax=Hibiscus sabdariffa TaxID=183260 RepID=A0ABR2P8Y6_9ROSI
MGVVSSGGIVAHGTGLFNKTWETCDALSSELSISRYINVTRKLPRGILFPLKWMKLGKDAKTSMRRLDPWEQTQLETLSISESLMSQMSSHSKMFLDTVSGETVSMVRKPKTRYQSRGFLLMWSITVQLGLTAVKTAWPRNFGPALDTSRSKSSEKGMGDDHNVKDDKADL